MRTETIKITPELAKDWLEQNTNNRPLNRRLVQGLVAAIKSGQWKLNGETIKLNGKELLDGQHRLNAVVEAGKCITSLVVFDIPKETVGTIDAGKRRSFGDDLHIGGYSNCNALAGAARISYDVENEITDGDSGAGYGLAPNRIDLGKYLDKNPGIVTSVEKLRTRIWVVLAPAIGCGLHYLFSKKDPLLADEFFDKLISGENITKSNPVYLLREKLLAYKADKKTRATRKELLAITIKAWNFTRRGEIPRMLKWKGFGPTAESFPAIE